MKKKKTRFRLMSTTRVNKTNKTGSKRKITGEKIKIISGGDVTKKKKKNYVGKRGEFQSYKKPFLRRNIYTCLTLDADIVFFNISVRFNITVSHAYIGYSLCYWRPRTGQSHPGPPRRTPINFAKISGGGGGGWW